MRTLIFFVIFAGMLGTSRGVAADGEAIAHTRGGQLVLRLRFEAAPARGAILLADVADVIADPQAAWPELRDLIVAPVRDARPITQGGIWRRLIDCGLAPSRFCLLGPALCRQGMKGAQP